MNQFERGCEDLDRDETYNTHDVPKCGSEVTMWGVRVTKCLCDHEPYCNVNGAPKTVVSVTFSLIAALSVMTLR